MIRISVTDLESFRYWMDSEDATLDDLLLRLAHASPPTRKMCAGRALAKLFEDLGGDDCLDSGHASDGEQEWKFHFDCHAKMLAPTVREMKVEVPFSTPSGTVMLVGKVDGLLGSTVFDQKLVEQFEVEGKYTDSLQWRAYLVMFHATRFVYDVFVGRVQDSSNEVCLTAFHQVGFSAYPGMADDVAKAVAQVAEVIARYSDRIESLKKR